MAEPQPTRYSDADLAEFRELLEKKLAKAEAERERIHQRLEELEEQADSDKADYVDDSSYAYDVEQLNMLEFRQRKHIQDLKNALMRIQNRTYGVCSITGQLIDKRRLLAVPTTTKSLEAKMRTQEVKKSDDDEDDKPIRKTPAPKEKKIITRVIKKPSSKPVPPPLDDDEEEDEIFPDLDDDMDDTEDTDPTDLDNLVHPDYE